MMYYRISKNEKNLFFGKKIAQVWAVTLSNNFYSVLILHLLKSLFSVFHGFQALSNFCFSYRFVHR